MPLLADEDRLHRRLHVVVDAARAGALEEGESPIMGVEHHLLRLARIGPRKHHPTVAEPDMRDLHRRRHAVDQHDLVAPVELVGLTGREAQRHIGLARLARVRLRPTPGIASNRVVATVIPERARLENPDQRQPFSRRRFVVRSKSRQVLSPGPNLRLRLHLTLVGELGLVRPQHLPHRIARQPQFAAIALIGFLEQNAPGVSSRSSPQPASPTARFTPKRAAEQTDNRGVNFGRRSPASGGHFHAGSHRTIVVMNMTGKAAASTKAWVPRSRKSTMFRSRCSNWRHRGRFAQNHSTFSSRLHRSGWRCSRHRRARAGRRRFPPRPPS